jgi:hypothetical protein
MSNRGAMTSVAHTSEGRERQVRVMRGIRVEYGHGTRKAEVRPLVIDLRDCADADVRAVCLRALHELATTAPLPEPRCAV